MENEVILYNQGQHQHALEEVRNQSNNMRDLALGLWKDLKPISYDDLVNDVLAEVKSMGDRLEGFKDKGEKTWENNVYYSYPQGGKIIHDASTYLMDMFIRKLHLVISLTSEFVELEGRRMIKITAQGVNPVNKTLETPTEFFYSAQVPEWCLRENKSNGNPYSKEQKEANFARGLQIITSNARSKARRDIAKLLVGRDIPKMIAQIAYASEVDSFKDNIKQAKDDCLDAFSGIGISENILVAYIGAPVKLWTALHVANLRGLYSRAKEAKENGDDLEVSMIFGNIRMAKAETEGTTTVADVLNQKETKTDNPVTETEENKPPRAKPKTRPCVDCKLKFHKSDVVDVEHPDPDAAAEGEVVDCCKPCYQKRQEVKPEATEQPEKPETVETPAGAFLVCFGCNQRIHSSLMLDGFCIDCREKEQS